MLYTQEGFHKRCLSSKSNMFFCSNIIDDRLGHGGIIKDLESEPVIQNNLLFVLRLLLILYESKLCTSDILSNLHSFSISHWNIA